ncbi:MAG TPA: MFS transporter [Candidatus Angelobacter sp.]|nr:MFS transporter [Candidatus Angelobacter sp.]
MATAAQPVTFKTILRQRPFRTLWLAQFVSVFGDVLALFGVINLITFRMHGTAVQVTAVTIAFALPLAVVGPVAGVFVDRWNVKRLMIASDLIRAVLILALVLARDVRGICVIFVLLSAVSSFFAPAQTVTLRTLVPAEGLMAANALMSQNFYVVRIFAPSLAALLIVALGENACFYLDSLSFLFSAAMLSTLIIARPDTETSGKTLKAFAGDFLAGNRFIFTHSGLSLVFMAMAVAMFVLSSFSPLISIYIRDLLHAGPFSFGVISSMVGVGLILGTQVVNRVARNRAPATVVMSGLLGLGVGVAFLGIFKDVPVAALGTFAMGLSVALVLVPAQTMAQRETPSNMMGRVSSSFLSLISLAQVLGLLLSGFLAQIIGVRLLFLASASLLALISGAGYFWTRDKVPVEHI